jgi:hypothetical protein
MVKMPLLDSAQKVVHVTLSGQMFSGAEEWQTGFYMGSATQDASVPTQQFADAVRDAWTTFFTHADSAISNSYSFTQVKAVRLAKDGRYDGTDPAVSSPAGTVTGSRPGSPMPAQVALVATLIAGSGKGLAGKGRMYLPGVSETISGNGHLDQGYCVKWATNLAAFFNTINGSFDAPGEVINVSRGHKKQLGLGARNVPVNGVRVGNVYDTQRRRRNALAETYSAATVAD